MSDKTATKRLRRCAIVLLACCSLVACLSVSTRFVTGLSAEERALAARLPVYAGSLPEGSYSLIERVSGLSCQINQADNFRASEKGAMEELKRAAVSVGGNAIVAVQCETLVRGAGARSCFHSVECQGDAVRFDSADTN